MSPKGKQRPRGSGVRNPHFLRAALRKAGPHEDKRRGSRAEQKEEHFQLDYSEALEVEDDHEAEDLEEEKE